MLRITLIPGAPLPYSPGLFLGVDEDDGRATEVRERKPLPCALPSLCASEPLSPDISDVPVDRFRLRTVPITNHGASYTQHKLGRL